MSDASGTLECLLADLRDILGGLRVAWEDGERAAAFMTELVELGLLLRHEPDLRDASELRAFLDESAAALEANLGALDLWMLDLKAAAAQLFVMGDEWAGLARERSALAFLRELYADTALAPWLDRFDAPDLDETLRYRCREDALLDPARIPDGMPREHWWWWCAQAP